MSRETCVRDLEGGLGVDSPKIREREEGKRVKE